jgi:hypothetical protein
MSDAAGKRFMLHRSIRGGAATLFGRVLLCNGSGRTVDRLVCGRRTLFGRFSGMGGLPRAQLLTVALERLLVAIEYA